MALLPTHLAKIIAISGVCTDCGDRFYVGQTAWCDGTCDVVLCNRCVDMCSRCLSTTAADDMMYDSEDMSVCEPCFDAGHARWKAKQAAKA